jgi:eukaryotic-like serine/threonine-protein kinase
MTLPPIAMPIAAGALFLNKYAPKNRIGAGSFGEVWLANDDALGHPFAIKILRPGLVVVDQLREAQIGHTFNHNNLVRVHQADVLTDGRVVIAMDYLAEGSITTLANPANFLPLPIALRAIIDVLQGLEHLHSSNFFHNDIKPENILRGPHGQAKLGDYGIVGVSLDGGPVPAPAQYIFHAAPETVVGNGIEARTDVFQTGLTLFRLLVGLGELRSRLAKLGKPAYHAALAGGTLVRDQDFPPFIPRAVVRVVKKAIHPSPEQRFQTALEMQRALERLSYPGHWTVDAIGKLVGEDARYTYRFNHVPAAGSNASLVALKTNKASGRQTQIGSYTKRNLTNEAAEKLSHAFIKAVVEQSI